MNRKQVIDMAIAFNHDLELIDASNEEALKLHEERISDYCYKLPMDLQSVFMDHCIMPEA